MESDKLAASISFIVGIAIGSNWPKIKKSFPAAGKKIRSFIATAAEAVEDTSRKMFSHIPGLGKGKKKTATAK